MMNQNKYGDQPRESYQEAQRRDQRRFHRKAAGAALALVMAGTACAGALHVKAQNVPAGTEAEKARQAAAAILPAGSVCLRVKWDDQAYEIKSLSADGTELYEVEVAGGKVLSCETDRIGGAGSASVVLKPSQVWEIVSKEHSGAVMDSLVTEKEKNGLVEYEVRLHTGTYRAEISVNPETGVILERSIDFNTAPATAPETSAVTREAALKTAQALVPAGSVFSGIRLDDGKWEADFFDTVQQELYEIEIDAVNGQALSLESERVGAMGGGSIKVKEQDIRNKVLAEYPGAVLDSVRLERDDGLWEYEVTFHSDKYRGEISLNPENGAVLERSLRYLNASAPQQTAQAGQASGTAAPVSADAAKALAMARVPGAVLKDFETDWEHGIQVYEGELYKDGWEYEFTINAATGAFLKWEADYDD